ncbi:Dam family site-specific DNA-(adenine-N6)-methyltransferase [Dermacoccus nishinomiyaensis]|uniref:Dam family site-specific DNA-(adenine-N6)-methyltransferase n=1 Tax=Dermacoccus nishinomiyaensis TaxID=1274 RepID=UPI001F5065B2|nr:Dam family site-specific DNA-(adenine-N6)-methyltransferase [Dermacoccus nishinomiyaensis]MCI0154129.1 Dam family site-specific DNA-(adenine-N6)-methyltransferase [Dermacoccus nishinomiyaensis]
MSNSLARAQGPQQTRARPVLKWAGGKTQIVNDIIERFPTSFGKFIEPFFGGGALFFALEPASSVIADNNPELINLYTSIRGNLPSVIDHLAVHHNDRDYFYEIRAQDWRNLPAAEAAARTIFLNKTCFNGLYRVNRSGAFNVPYAGYKNPKILDIDNLQAVSNRLQNVDILLGDYRAVLGDRAEPGDLIFLDPPYLPVSKYSDFKRYTKEQFFEEDHVELANEVQRLHELGCHVVLTNSNHPLVHDLYRGFKIDILQTKRHISARGDRRTGEDVVVEIPPKQRFSIGLAPEPLDEQTKKFPTTRYMGSKSKLLTDIWSVASQFEYENVLDLFAGSGIVSYMFKAKGKSVLSNDYMAFSANVTKALIENSNQILPIGLAHELVENRFPNDGFVSRTFGGLYYEDVDNEFIDSMRMGISKIGNPHQRAIAMAALTRACLKKRPRGIFTYTGMRYNDGRRDLQTSFPDHFLAAAASLNEAVFDNGARSKSRHGDAMTVGAQKNALVYIDPPYHSPYSDNEYVRRYHFVEGLARNWEGVEIQEHTATKKFKSYPTPFSSRNGAHDAFDRLFRRHRDSVLLVSYSSNSRPSLDEMVALMSRYKRHVEVVPVNHSYSFGNQGHKVGDNRNRVLEYLFVGY